MITATNDDYLLPQFARAHNLTDRWCSVVLDAQKDFARYRFPYPWTGLEDALITQDPSLQNGQLSLIGYGSLMDPRSAARTIRDTPVEGHPPVVAFGARRLYDYIMPPDSLHKYTVAEPEGIWSVRERAALNLRATNNPEDLFNGRKIPFSLEDLPALRVREKAYDLEPVAVVDWDRLGERPQLGFALSCPLTPYEGETFVDRSLLPFPPYHRLCYVGAQMVSEEFAELFLATTYLGDGVTRVTA